jgi:heat shock protein HslJ
MSCEVEKPLEFNSKSILGDWDIKGGGIISIESKSFSLSAGCNTLFGDVKIKNKNLFFSTIASTRIACQEDEISCREQKLAVLLDNKNLSFLIKDDRAELYNTNGEIILILIRPSNVNLINQWSLISLRLNDGVSSSALDKNTGIIFLNNSEVKISTACNNGGGNFFEEFNNITFSGLSFTEKSCDQEKNIREQEFTSALSKINSYSILRNILSLKKDDIEYIRFSLKD